MVFQNNNHLATEVVDSLQVARSSAMKLAFSSLFAGMSEDAANKQVATTVLEAKKTLQEANNKKLATSTVSILTAAQEVVTGQLTLVRSLRKQEKDATERMRKVNLANAYFEETGNFGPLAAYLPSHIVQVVCRELGVDYPTHEEQKIPDGWKPKEVKDEVVTPENKDAPKA